MTGEIALWILGAAAVPALVWAIYVHFGLRDLLRKVTESQETIEEIQRNLTAVETKLDLVHSEIGDSKEQWVSLANESVLALKDVQHTVEILKISLKGN